MADAFTELEQASSKNFHKVMQQYDQVISQFAELKKQCDQIYEKLQAQRSKIQASYEQHEIFRLKSSFATLLQQTESTDDSPLLADGIKQIKEHFDFSGQKIVFMQALDEDFYDCGDQFHEKMGFLMKKLSQTFNFMEQTEFLISWEFEKSPFKQSPEIASPEFNTYRGTKGTQVLRSPLCFSSGSHGCELQILQANGTQNHFYIGLLNENFKDGFPGCPNPYQCIYCDSKSGFSPVLPQKKVTAGDTFKITLNMSTRSCSIYQNNTKCYSLQENFGLAGFSWRIQL